MAPEWFTVKQFAKHYELGEATSYRKLMELVEDGKLECWYGISFVNRRMMRKFRIKQKKNAPNNLPPSPSPDPDVFPGKDNEVAQEVA